ncbi:MAG: hypothetical protein WCF25_12810 [Acidimicrobiales bacterium]
MLSQFEPRRFLSRVDWLMLGLGLLIGIAVCIPFFGGGRLYLLDWSIGPTTPIVSINTLGLFGGLTSGVVGSLLTGLLNWALGSVSTWLLFLLFFPTAFLGISRLAGGSLTSRISAGVLYTVNPFVFNRLFVGHIDLLIGYALLPFAVISALRLQGPLWRYALRVSLWWAALTAITPHFAWIYGVVVLVVAVVAASKGALRESVERLAATIASFFIMSMYLLLPHFVTTLATSNGPSSLALYQTSGDSRFGLFGNVAGLYGFWRLGPGPTLPKNLISGWPFLFLAIFLVAVTGAWVALRKTRTSSGDDAEAIEADPGRTPISDLLQSEPTSTDSEPPASRAFMAVSLLAVGIIGYLLALGSQGPTGALFRWCYVHVPFFAIMREPQKFLMLLAISYAVFFGWGISHISRLMTSTKATRAAVAALVLGIALPLGYTPTMFNGLSAQIAPSHVPSSYQEANVLMGNGAGNVLALPWHLYLSYPFTNDRVVANLTPSLFTRNVISGDNVEAGGVETQSTSLESKYLQELYARGSTLKHFGALIAPLGVKYVVLSKTVDWPAYLWLTHQSDLKMILDTSSLEVWKNLAYDRIGQPHVTLSAVASLNDAVKEVKNADSSFGLVSPRVARKAKSLATSASTSTAGVTSGDAVSMVSPVAFHIDPGSPGWVEIDEPYQVGWSLNGVAALPSAEGSMLVYVGAHGGNVVFTPWRSARLGYIISGGAFLLIVLALNFERVRRRARSRVRAPAP